MTKNMVNKNTAQLWDSLWNDPAYRKGDIRAIEKEYRSIRWQRIERMVCDEFGSFDKLKVVELGAGAGKVAALFARRGANVTLIDYSEGALRRARELFEQFHLKAEYIHTDIFDLPDEFSACFDVSMSFGLTEHFKGEKRLLANKVHLDVLRPGGLAFVAVPNRHNPPYRIYKFFAEITGTWKYGEEYPYSRKEFVELMKSLDVASFGFFGDSFINSIRFVNPIGDVRKALNLPPRWERGTPLDAYISYALVLWAKKAGMAHSPSPRLGG